MKKRLLLSVAATLVAFAASAQNRAIDALAEKYADREGFTVVSMEGEAIKALSSMASNGNGTINLGDGAQSYQIGELLDEIVSVTAVILKKVDEEFSSEIQEIVASPDYSSLVSVSADKTNLKVSSADIKRGKFRGNKEIVVAVKGSDATLLVRVIGNIDTKLLAEMISKIDKS